MKKGEGCMITCIYEGKRINSLDLYESNEEYKQIKIASQSNELYCEECGSLVVFHGDRIKTFHFKHKKEEACFFTHYAESQVMMEIKRVFYDYLKKNYSQYEIIVNYKHSNGVRSHFYIPGLSLILHLQRGNSKVEEWENRIKEIREQGFKVKWYFFSAKTLSMEKATLVSKDSIFRRIEKGFDEISFKSQVDIKGRNTPVELSKSYPIGNKGIFELEEKFKNDLIQQKDEIERDIIRRAEERVREQERAAREKSVKIEMQLKVTESFKIFRKEEAKIRKKGYIDELVDSFMKKEIIGGSSRRLHSNYIDALNKGWVEVADKISLLTKIELKAFVILFILKEYEGAIGYFYKQKEYNLYLLNPFNEAEVIEIPEIKKGNNTVKGKVYDKGFESFKNVDFSIIGKGSKEVEISSDEGEFGVKFIEVKKGFYLVKCDF